MSAKNEMDIKYIILSLQAVGDLIETAFSTNPAMLNLAERFHSKNLADGFLVFESLKDLKSSDMYKVTTHLLSYVEPFLAFEALKASHHGNSTVLDIYESIIAWDGFNSGLGEQVFRERYIFDYIQAYRDDFEDVLEEIEAQKHRAKYGIHLEPTVKGFTEKYGCNFDEKCPDINEMRTMNGVLNTKFGWFSDDRSLKELREAYPDMLIFENKINFDTGYMDQGFYSRMRDEFIQKTADEARNNILNKHPPKALKRRPKASKP